MTPATIHKALIDELRLRRINFIKPSHMVLLLKHFVFSGNFRERSELSAAFFLLMDRYLGKNADSLNEIELDSVFRLYDIVRGHPDTLNKKLLIKM